MDATAALLKYLEALAFLWMNVRAREMKAAVSMLEETENGGRVMNL